MELAFIMIAAAIVISVIWAAFIYIIEIRKDRKIMDDYIIEKHKRKARSKKLSSRGKTPILTIKEANVTTQKPVRTA